MVALVGRAAEVGRIEQLLAGAASGESGTLLLLGDAGIGKSALLDAAAASAREREMTLLRARAVEAETALAFAGLSELLRPLTPLLDELEPAHAAALRAALGSGGGAPQPPFAVAVALLSLLEAAAMRAPSGVALVVDDAHWLDEASLDALCFAARRLLREGVVVLVAARPEPDRGLAARGLEPLPLAPLGDDDARAVVRAEAGGDGERPLAEPALERVLEAAAGNPLALVELTRALSDAEREGAVAAREPIRPSAAIERAYRAELAALPPATARALLLPAADEKLPLAGIHAALERLGLEPVALEPAERAGLLHAEQGRLRFRHPLLRAVVYHAAPFAERAAAHRALAAALAAAGEAPNRRAWHLAAAAAGPDAEVAALLVAAAGQARDRGALDAAAHALARAAELTPPAAADAPASAADAAVAAPAPTRAARELDAAEAYAAVGQPARALELAQAALADPALPSRLRPAAQHLRGTVTMRSGQLDAGARILVEQAEAAAGADPTRAARMLLDANVRNRIVGDYAAMTSAAERIATLAGAAGDPALAALGELHAAVAAANRGELQRADAAIARHEPLLLDPASARWGAEQLAGPAHAAIWLERFARAERVLATLIGRARERSAVTELIYPLAVRGQLELRRGRPAAAERDGAEALRLALETRQHSLVAIAAGLLAGAEAALGREADCREHAALSIAICDALGADAMGMWGRAALGLLDLGLGHPQVAIAPLEECRRHAERIGMREPAVVQWTGDLVEALLRAGRGEEAAALLPRLRAGETAWARATLLRCEGLLADEADGAELLAAAAGVADEAGLAFEAARSRLCLGERLRRGRQRRAAREPLEAARAAFEAAGAAPWAARARDELRASGQPTGRPRGGDRDELTPHERRVALLVAEGRTNPEVAAELYITRKTVEHHLSQVYRKLGLRSRTELSNALGRDAGARAAV